MSKLPRLSGKEVIKALSKIGFRVTRQRKHVVLRHNEIMTEEQAERKSLEDLQSMLDAARKQSIKLVIIGGYAVAAYTRGYRYTKDLVADKPKVGNFKGLLKNLGYSVRGTEFGIAGAKNLRKRERSLSRTKLRVCDQIFALSK